MQMPPTSSISRASTVAKIGRPMKKLTMAVLAPVAEDRRRWGSGLVRPGRVVGHGFRSGSRGVPVVRVALLGGRARLGYAERVGRRRLGLDRHPGADQLQPLDDHLLAGLEARFEDAEALVGEGRPDRGDGHLALLVDRVDRRTGLRLDHGLLGDDDRVLGLADLGVGLHVLAGQERSSPGWRPPPGPGRWRSSGRSCCR